MVWMEAAGLDGIKGSFWCKILWYLDAFITQLATKHHLQFIPGGHSLHTRSISSGGGSLFMTPTPKASCVLGRFQCIYQSNPMVRHQCKPALCCIRWQRKEYRLPKALCRMRMHWHSPSNCQEGRSELFGSCVFILACEEKSLWAIYTQPQV